MLPAATDLSGTPVTKKASKATVGKRLINATAKTANYTLLASDEAILFNATGGNLVAFLPAVASTNGKTYYIKKTDSSSNTVTLTADGVETIDGTSTKVISVQNGFYIVTSTGTDWKVFGSNDTDVAVSIGGAVNSGTTGSVLIVGSGPVLAQDNANFFWDDTNNRLGVGTTTPIAPLEVYGGIATTFQNATTFGGGFNVYKRGTTGDANAPAPLLAELGYHGFYGWNGSAYGRGAYVIASATEGFTTSGYGSSYRIFTAANGTVNATRRIMIDQTGFIGIGGTNLPRAMLDIISTAAGNTVTMIQGAASQSADLTQWQNSAGTVLARTNSSGFYGFNQATPAHIIHLSPVLTSQTTAIYGILADHDITQTADIGTVSATGATLRLRGSVNQTASTTGPSAGVFSAFNSNTGTVTLFSGVRLDSRNLSTGTITNLQGLYITDALNSGGGVITNNYGVRINDQTAGTNIYGLGLAVSSGTTKYNVYASGTAQNHFAGFVGIGIIAPTAALHVVGNNTIITSNVAGSSYVLAMGGATGGTSTQFSKLYNTTTAGAVAVTFAETDGTSGSTPAWIRRYGSTHATIPNGFEFWNANAGAVLIGTNNVERIRILSGGDTTFSAATDATGIPAVGSVQLAGGLVSAKNIVAGTGFWRYKSANGSTGAPVTDFVTGWTNNNGAQNGAGMYALNSLTSDSSVWLQFKTNVAAGTLTTAMTIDAFQDVGIGETAPNARLQVKNLLNTTVVGAGRTLILDGVGGGTRVVEIGLGSLAGGSTNHSPTLIGAINRSAVSFGNADLYFATRALTTDTAAIVRMTVQNDGLVGIGTTAPANLLEVQTTNAGAVTTLARFRNMGTTAGTESRILLSTMDSVGSVAISSGISSVTVSPTSPSADMVFSTTNTGFSEKMRLLANGNVGIGTAAPGAMLQVNASAAGTIGSIIKGATSQTANLTQWQNSVGTVVGGVTAAGLNYVGAAPVLSGNYEAALAGIYGFVDGGSRIGATTIISFYSAPNIASDVTSQATGFRWTPATVAAAFTVTNMRGLHVTNATIGSTSAITNQIGVAINDLSGATNNYGYVGDLTAGTNKYNLRMAGTAQNYLEGNLGVGIAIPTSKLHVSGGGIGVTGNTAPFAVTVSGTVTGGTTAVNFYAVGTGGSDSTVALEGFRSLPITQTAAYNTTGVTGFRAQNMIIGSGSTVTNQHGVLVSALSGATNNYGVTSQVAASAAHWNIFASGTAKSHFAGYVGIGTASTTPLSTLDVIGGVGHGIVTKTGNYTATADDYMILVDATAGAVTITLPAVAGATRRIYIIKKIDSSINTVTIDGNAAETIDGTTTKVLATQYSSLTIQCDAATWWVQ